MSATPKFQVGDVAITTSLIFAIVAGQRVQIPVGTTVQIMAINITGKRVRYQLDYADAWAPEYALRERLN